MTPATPATPVGTTGSAPTDVDVHDLADLLHRARFRYTLEADLQAGIADVLAGSGWPWRREVTLARGDRIDFVVGRVGVEVKTNGTPIEVRRQLQRYARSRAIDSLLLVTTRQTHNIALLGHPIGGKPLGVVVVGAWL